MKVINGCGYFLLNIKVTIFYYFCNIYICSRISETNQILLSAKSKKSYILTKGIDWSKSTKIRIQIL